MRQKIQTLGLGVRNSHSPRGGVDSEKERTNHSFITEMAVVAEKMKWKMLFLFGQIKNPNVVGIQKVLIGGKTQNRNKSCVIILHILDRIFNTLKIYSKTKVGRLMRDILNYSNLAINLRNFDKKFQVWLLHIKRISIRNDH